MNQKLGVNRILRNSLIDRNQTSIMGFKGGFCFRSQRYVSGVYIRKTKGWEWEWGWERERERELKLMNYLNNGNKWKGIKMLSHEHHNTQQMRRVAILKFRTFRTFKRIWHMSYGIKKVYFKF